MRHSAPMANPLSPFTSHPPDGYDGSKALPGQHAVHRRIMHAGGHVGVKRALFSKRARALAKRLRSGVEASARATCRLLIVSSAKRVKRGTRTCTVTL